MFFSRVILFGLLPPNDSILKSSNLIILTALHCIRRKEKEDGYMFKRRCHC